MESQFVDLLYEIQSSVNRILQILESPSKPSIVNLEPDRQVDLIDSFKKELVRLGIDFNLNGVKSKTDLKNRAVYYFTNQSKISSPRAYLLKVLGQLEFLPDAADPADEVRPNPPAEETNNDYYLGVFGRLAPDHIAQAIQSDKILSYLFPYGPPKVISPTNQILIGRAADRLGLVSLD